MKNLSCQGIAENELMEIFGKLKKLLFYIFFLCLLYYLLLFCYIQNF